MSDVKAEIKRLSEQLTAYQRSYYVEGRSQVSDTEYDRLFDRIMDNSKVLQATGMTQDSLTKLYDGLAREIARCPKDHPWPANERMDEYLENRKAN